VQQSFSSKFVSEPLYGIQASAEKQPFCTTLAFANKWLAARIGLDAAWQRVSISASPQ